MNIKKLFIVLFIIVGSFKLYGEIKILDFDKKVPGVKFKGFEKKSVPDKKSSKEYGLSGYWGRMKDIPQIRIKGFKKDWSKENSIMFDVYSVKPTHKLIYLALYSDNPETEKPDYYKYSFRVNWVGWKKFVISFSNFRKVRNPIGFNKIEYIKMAANWKEEPDNITELYFDNILVGRALEIPAIIGDNMILQADKPINIWGKGTPDEKVEVILFSKNKKIIGKCKANKKGNWKVVLNKLKSGGPYKLKIKGKSSVIIFNNIYIGDVWLCGGQSNMYFQLYKDKDGKEEIKKANYPNLRLFSVKRALSLKPIDTVSGKWEVCTPESVKNFSAVAYYFGKNILQNSKKRYIGLIMDCWGGTSAEAWMSKDAINKNEKLDVIREMMKSGFQDFNLIVKEYKKWDNIRKEYKKRGITDKRELPIKQPRKPHKIPTVLFNAMIHPILRFNIKGVIWYQGESNANTKTYRLYYELLTSLIKDWREKWGYNFPFYFVQLPNYLKPTDSPVEKNAKWPMIRDAQLRTLKTVKDTGMAVTIDVGEANNIHPPYKKPVGYRLSLWALAKCYNKKLVYSGPIYKSYKIKKDKIIISFEPYSIGDGLVIKNSDRLKGFAIAGKDKKFRKANAFIKGNKIIVFNKSIKNPIAVRYGWASNPDCNLYNKNGLPASPFRTDNWNK